MMRIGEVAKEGGVSVQAVRYYERRGLVPLPARRPSGYHDYPPRAVRRVRAIRWAQSLGFHLNQIVERNETKRFGMKGEKILGADGRAREVRAATKVRRHALKLARMESPSHSRS